MSKSWLAELQARANRIVPMREAGGATVDSAETGWSPLGGGRNRRDLAPLAQSRMQELAAYVWESNRIANRLIELPLAFLLGEGVKIEVADVEAQSWVDDFWADPINRMDLNLENHVRELSIFGEQCWPVFVSPVTGKVRLGKVDPSTIEKVITDPDNISLVIGVVVMLPGNKRKVYRVIYNGLDEDLFGEGARKLRESMLAGDCFFYRINALSTGKRGRSDLLSAIDFADAYEQLLFGEVERAETLRRISYDVTVTGATQDDLDERAKEIETPAPLSIRLHNENERWELLTPSLQAGDAETTARLIRNHILGGATVPEPWFGGGGDVNLATATSMGEPTYKIFSQRQKLWKAILEDIATFVIRSRIKATSTSLLGLAAEADYQPRAIFPELASRDVSKYATALQQVVVGCSNAVSAGVMSVETAVKAIGIVITLLGLEVDPATELEAARAEAEKRREQDAFVMPVEPVEPVPLKPAPDMVEGE